MFLILVKTALCIIAAIAWLVLGDAQKIDAENNPFVFLLVTFIGILSLAAVAAL